MLVGERKKCTHAVRGVPSKNRARCEILTYYECVPRTKAKINDHERKLTHRVNKDSVGMWLAHESKNAFDSL